MSKITPQERPTFKVAHWYRCQGLCERQNFLNFQEKFIEMVETITNPCTDDKNELWKYVRTLFDFDDYADCIPINAANLSIAFNPVQLFMNSLALDWNRDISIQKRQEPFVYTIQQARELIANELNVKPELIAFQRNGSDPNAAISNGLDFQRGEQVVLWSENHPTGGEVAWKIRKDRFPNINIVVVDIEDEKDPKKIIKMFVDAVNSQTKIVVFSEISHLTGMRLPAKKLIAEIHKKNLKTHVHLDGAQSWGSMKHDLVDIDCDSYCGGSHKWFLGPKETGILYMKKNCIPKFAPKDIGYDGEMKPPPTLSEKTEAPVVLLQDDASRFEMVGQRNDTNLIGLLYTADLMNLIGFDNIEDRIKALATRIRENLIELQEDLDKQFGSQLFEIETPNSLSMYHGIMVIKFNDKDPNVIKAQSGKKVKGRKGKPCEEHAPPAISTQIYELLYENHKIGVSTKKGNRMRFSPHIYNTEEHIGRLTEAMKFELFRILSKKE